LARLRAGSAESAETAQVVADFNALDIFAPICDNGGNAESSPDRPSCRLESVMTTATELRQKRCVSCESGVPALSQDQVRALLGSVPHWQLAADGKRIRREWKVRDFMEAIAFFGRVAQIAQAEDHHPDLHLIGYRDVTIEISTHAVGGLTENDFILAAKIDTLPVELKK
jgi:4a-hydroxytetrahydrobiopterin dehydratase